MAIRAAPLELPARQAMVCGHRVDCWWASVRLVVEADGRSIHQRRTTVAADARRDGDFAAAGLQHLRVFPEHLRGDARPQTVARLARLVPPARRAPPP